MIRGVSGAVRQWSRSVENRAPGDALPMAGFLHEKQAQVAASRQGDDPDEPSLPESAPRLHRPVAVLCREGFRCDKAEECADALGAVFRGFELGEDAPSEGGCCRQFRFVQGAYGGVGRFFHVYAYKATAAGNRSGRRCVWCLPVLERQVVHFCRGRGV